MKYCSVKRRLDHKLAQVKRLEGAHHLHTYRNWVQIKSRNQAASPHQRKGGRQYPYTLVYPTYINEPPIVNMPCEGPVRDSNRRM